MSRSVSPQERKAYWVSLVLLLLVVPIAIVMNSPGEFVSWAERRMERPKVVERGDSGQLGGGVWRLAPLSRLAGTLPDTNLMLAEIDVFARDMAALPQSCELTLTDGTGRRWEPLPLPGLLLRDAAPAAAGGSQCSTLQAGELEGQILRVVELYLVPHDAEGFSLSLAVPGEPPLVLK